MLFSIFVYFAAVVFLVAIVAIPAREIVKTIRGGKWCDEHPGMVIGSQGWAEWCEKEGIDPKYFI